MRQRPPPTLWISAAYSIFEIAFHSFGSYKVQIGIVGIFQFHSLQRISKKPLRLPVNLENPTIEIPNGFLHQIFSPFIPIVRCPGDGTQDFDISASEGPSLV
jgi:hypothetical protein